MAPQIINLTEGEALNLNGHKPYCGRGHESHGAHPLVWVRLSALSDTYISVGEAVSHTGYTLF